MKPCILPYFDQTPRIDPKAFIAPTAAVIGDVEIGEDTGIWFGVTVRGDVNHIRIGSRTNIQDGSVVHVTRRTHPTLIGNGVTIGHKALLHGCVLEDRCFIGMGATVMDGAVVEEGAMVAAGALVTPNKRILKGQLWAGSPAKYFRDLTPEEIAFIPVSEENYVKHCREYRDQLLAD